MLFRIFNGRFIGNPGFQLEKFKDKEMSIEKTLAMSGLRWARPISTLGLRAKFSFPYRPRSSKLRPVIAITIKLRLSILDIQACTCGSFCLFQLLGYSRSN